MVYRVARALFEYAQQHESPFLQDSWLFYARAAVAAMREPTDKMLQTASAGSAFPPYVFSTREAWSAMVDAALQETP